jgi:UPF0271 protein
VVIDLNSDLGEGFGAYTMSDDAALLDVVTSANIACGFHGGDPVIMRRTCDLAVAHGVRIGAHISYRDLAGFGRRAISMPAQELTDECLYQIGALDGFARLAGTRVRYVKPHGALYNTAVTDEVQAAAVVAAVAEYDRSLPVLGLPGSALLRLAARAGLRAVPEGFVDRGYRPDGTLVPRSEPGALLRHDEAVAQAVRLATEGLVESLCVHGDTPGAVALARAVRASLTGAGVPLEPFQPAG